MSEKIPVTDRGFSVLQCDIIAVIRWDSPDLIQALRTLAKLRDDEEIAHIDTNSSRIMIGIRERKDVE